MAGKFFEEINVRFPKTKERLEKAYESCEKRKKFVSTNEEFYIEHLELSKDDLNSLKTDFENKNWRWSVIENSGNYVAFSPEFSNGQFLKTSNTINRIVHIKSYYAIFHATNALLVKKKGFFSKDHLCAVLALKKENLIPDNVYHELGDIYGKFSDIFGFAVMFEARKLSQYDTKKWKELNENDATIALEFARKYVLFVEGACR